MKKLILGSLLAVFSFAIFATSCSKDNPVSCAEKLTQVSAASDAYYSDGSTANCTAYKDAINDYINCDGIVDKSYWEGVLSLLDC